MSSEAKKPPNGNYVYRSNDGDEVSHKFFAITEEEPFVIDKEAFKVITKIFRIEKEDNVIFLKRMGMK